MTRAKLPVGFVELSSPRVRVLLDAGLGADVLSMVDVRTGRELLFRSPWLDRADAIRRGQRPAAEPAVAWLEQYRGGWQTLCPVAGDPRVVHGAAVGFHGEASRIPWRVVNQGKDSLELAVDLFTVPVRIEREVTVDGPSVTITDHVSNLSPVQLDIDYCHHPAFGGELLDSKTVLETNARFFTPDTERDTALRLERVEWPHGTTKHGDDLDLSVMPGPGTRRDIFGWLSDFDQSASEWSWGRIINPELNAAVRVEWSGLPYAWLWIELEHTPTFPWFQRARVVAFEPASCQTSGPGRETVFALGAHGSRHVTVRVTLEEWRDNG